VRALWQILDKTKIDFLENSKTFITFVTGIIIIIIIIIIIDINSTDISNELQS
jgi:uncharacterized integral membrane protein